MSAVEDGSREDDESRAEALQNFGERQQLAQSLIKELRTRLLDLKNNNRLLNFRFSDRSRSHIRVIDELPDVLYAKLIEEEKTVIFEALPEPDEGPDDETTPEYLRALEEALLTDDEYKNAIVELGAQEEGSEAAQRLERKTRDKIRGKLGMPARAGRDKPRPAEYAKSLGWNPSYDLPMPSNEGPGDVSHQDNQIRTLLFQEQMQRKLSGIRVGARLSQEELGINTLFVAFGFLEWYEDSSSDVPLFAPLLLLPVDLRQNLVHRVYRYAITGTGDETEINLTLQERLRRDFNLELPELEEGDTPESYFAKVSLIVSTFKRWRVRRFMTMGLFTFSRLVMYKDLDTERWPSTQALEKHAVLVDLLSGADTGGSTVAEEYDVDDDRVRAKVPILISEADSSQFSAIVDVLSGRNMAIKGPPGTGKSQTITNLISAALSLGKRVLFVAEKMAALEVVKKRLDAAGIGDFCLELHSTKAKKSVVLDALRQRLENSSSPPARDFEETMRDYKDQKEKLTHYVGKLNTAFGASGRSLHEIIWGSNRAEDAVRGLNIPRGMLSVELRNALEWTSPEVGSKRSALAALEKKAQEVLAHCENLSTHACACLGFEVRSPFEVDEAVESIREWKDSLLAIEDAVASANAETGSTFLCTRSVGEHIASILGEIPERLEGQDAQLMPALRVERNAAIMEEYLRAVEERAREWDGIECAFNCPEAKLPTDKEVTSFCDRLCGAILCAGADAVKVGELKQLAEIYTDTAVSIERVHSGLQSPIRVLGLPERLTLDEAFGLVQGVRLLRETPQEVLHSRTSEIFGEKAHGTLVALEREAKALREESKKLSERFVLSYGEDPRDYEAFCLTLRVSGILARVFGRQYRQAKMAWRLVQRQRRRASSFLMAAELDSLRNHIERRRAFCTDDRVRSLCGSVSIGIETNFDVLIRACAFGREVNRRINGEDGASESLRRSLLEADVAKLESLMGSVPEVLCQEIEALRGKLALSGDIHLKGAVVDLAAKFRTAAAELSKVYEDIVAAHVKSQVTGAELRLLAQKIKRLAESRAKLEQCGDASKLFDGRDFTSPPVRERAAKTILFAQQIARRIPVGALRDWILSPRFEERAQLAKRLRIELETSLKQEKQMLEVLLTKSKVDPVRACGGTIDSDIDFQHAIRKLDILLEDQGALADWTEICRLRRDVEVAGVGEFLIAAWPHREILCNLRICFDSVYHRTVLHEIFRSDPELARFSGLRQAEIQRRFQELDKKIIQLQRQKLAADLYRASVPPGVGTGPRRHWTERALIQNEIGKKKRHIPIRILVKRANGALLALKPCWMMSPASVAQFVPAGLQPFDFVVIDEASQMKPEEAIGAIARGKQVVVVGDTKQLPPTTFFERTESFDENEEESEDFVESESILDLALSIFRPSRDLRWHYRSRHESLVAFSNRHFYEDRLVIFPSSFAKSPEYGVELRYIQGRYSKGGTNVPEARAVAGAAVEFMHRYPDKSLGIVTMNRSQTDLLQEEMDLMLQGDSMAEEYRLRWEGTLESFFVKNLENVQGDERDVIFISIVYGPDEAGNIHQRFGPINSAEGHRRLNVLFTRAKEKVVVFSSMRSSDIVPSPTSREGISILKRYLEYAEAGQLESGVSSGRPPDSDFEIAVAKRLGCHGLAVVAQVGVAGFFIDLAVRSCVNSDRYLLGIECDGASYHSAKSARDRDRLRQEILERLGWKLYRIWSTDWYQDPEGSTRKLVNHVRHLMEEEKVNSGVVDDSV